MIKIGILEMIKSLINRRKRFCLKFSKPEKKTDFKTQAWILDTVLKLKIFYFIQSSSLNEGSLLSLPECCNEIFS